jgi:hypothetical protein
VITSERDHVLRIAQRVAGGFPARPPRRCRRRDFLDSSRWCVHLQDAADASLRRFTGL